MLFYCLCISAICFYFMYCMLFFLIFVGFSFSVILWFVFVVEACITGNSTLPLLGPILDFDNVFPASSSFL